MTHSRWITLMNDDSLSLTQAEIDQGWHFCNEMDGLLRQPADSDDPKEWVCQCCDWEKLTKWKDRKI